jgi:hypothetical protein
MRANLGKLSTTFDTEGAVGFWRCGKRDWENVLCTITGWDGSTKGILPVVIAGSCTWDWRKKETAMTVSHLISFMNPETGWHQEY